MKVGQKNGDYHAKNVFFIEYDEMIENFRQPELNLRESERLNEHGYSDIQCCENTVSDKCFQLHCLISP